MELDVIKTRLLMQPELAFYASVLFQLDVSINNKIETAATNGKYIHFNETFMDQFTLPKQMGVMVHEVLHVAYLHMFRGEHLEHKRFNAACDYHINAHILNRLGLELPKDRLYDPKYNGMSAEEIYALLPEQGNKPDFDDLEEGDEGEGETSEAEVQGMIQQAAMEAEIQRQTGTIPSDILRRIEEEKNPLLPWQTILARYAQEKAQDDYSWQQRNLYYPNHYLPSLYSETIGTISIYVDCSCSVTKDELAQYVSEIRQIMYELNPISTNVVSFDTAIQTIQTIEQDEQTEIILKGGGGTALHEVADMINDREDAVSILFTDGHYQEVIYNKPVLHIIINNSEYVNADHDVIHAVI